MNITATIPQQKHAKLEIVYPKSMGIDAHMEWWKAHPELRELQFSHQQLNRATAIRQKLESLSWTAMRVFEDSERNAWTHDKQLEQINEWIYDTAAYRKLPNWAQSELAGVLWTLRKQQDRKLVWTHVLNGVRYASRAPELEGNLSNIEDKESAHCWQTKDGFVRFN